MRCPPRALRLAAAAAVAIGACSAPRAPQVRVIDLLKTGMVEKRPVNAEFHVEEHTFGTDTRATLAVPADSRAIWQIALPRRATLQTSVGITGASASDAATFRIGISDQRVYELLVERTVTVRECAGGWVPLSVDLSGYAGWQWSLFYRPDGRKWRVVMAVSRVSGAPAKAFWSSPGIDTDTVAARQFARRAG